MSYLVLHGGSTSNHRAKGGGFREGETTQASEKTYLVSTGQRKKEISRRKRVSYNVLYPCGFRRVCKVDRSAGQFYSD